MKELRIAITAASYSGNKGAAAMLQSSIRQLYEAYGEGLNISLMSVYPSGDRQQVPWDFVRIVPCKPEMLLFVAFPLAILYRLFRWCPPLKALLLKNKILREYNRSDAVLDEAGISFVDSRGVIMNTYAFVCAAVPMLVGTPVMKYSQAMGTFKSLPNRLLAKWILPKMKLICARGKGTQENLREIGVEKNVCLCADGAFTMADSEPHKKMVEAVCREDAEFYAGPVIGLSISSVVEKKCEKLSIDYKKIMIEFIEYLNRRGYRVLLIANAARINSQKSRNNDLMVGDAIYEGTVQKDMVRWYHKEMDAEEIREYIGRCKYLVASRFHAMVGALEKKVPVLLVGWSHKYQEVLDYFELGQYAIDFSALTAESLEKEFERFESEEAEIRRKLDLHYDSVMASSRQNVVQIKRVLDGILAEKEERLNARTRAKGTLEWDMPERYIGPYLKLRKGYAAHEEDRLHAASGGMITALLCDLLRAGEIDGAWVTKTEIEDGKLGYKTWIATTEDEIRDSGSSVYMWLPLLQHVDMLRAFHGKLAVVLTPCQMEGFSRILEKEPELREKIVLKIGLYCSGNHDIQATLTSLKQASIDLTGASRLYYRQGHWRGQSVVEYKDGSVKTFSYTKTICAYKNAFFYEKGSCMTCQDHFAKAADLSFGDIWLKEMKNETIKHSSCVIRTEQGLRLYQDAVSRGALKDSHISGRDMVRSQKRALVFKFNCLPAKKKLLQKKTPSVKTQTKETVPAREKCSWNHRLAARLAVANRNYSVQHPDKLEKIPHMLIYYYMCFIRVLLSF